MSKYVALVMALAMTLTPALWAGTNPGQPPVGGSPNPSVSASPSPVVSVQPSASDAVAMPRLLTCQGSLLDASGKSVPDGDYSVQFSLYPAATGGTAFWTETQAVSTRDGRFTVPLGSLMPLGSFPDGDCYLAMKVGSDQEMTPRFRITSGASPDLAGNLSGSGADAVVDWDDGGTGHIYPVSPRGLSMRNYNTLYSSTLKADSTHVNFGVWCTTGTINTDKYYCTVGGGYGNWAKDSGATVDGGFLNYAEGRYSTVGGGRMNKAGKDYATVGGGQQNTAAGGSYVYVGGGYSNSATVAYGVASGGYKNKSSATAATVGGGYQNIASGQYSTVGGGYYDTASSKYASVGSGRHNVAGRHAPDSAAAVCGGLGNLADSTFAFVGGGGGSGARGWASTVGGGYGNTASGLYAVVPGGTGVTAAADYTLAFGESFTTTTPRAVVFYHSGGPTKLGVGVQNPAYNVDVAGTGRFTTSGGGVNGVEAYSSGGPAFYTNKPGMHCFHADTGGASYTTFYVDLSRYNAYAVESTGNDGLWVTKADGRGVYVGNAGSYGVYANSNDSRGGYFRNNNNSNYALTAWNNTGTGGTVRGLYVQGHGYATGGWQSLLDGGKTGYSVVSPDMEIMASGTGRLVGGRATISLEKTFRDAVSGDVPLKVIVTPNSMCNGICVTSRSADGFSVAELADGSSDAGFDWIAIGRLKGGEQCPAPQPVLSDVPPERDGYSAARRSGQSE